MVLTPEDIANKDFSRGIRGFNENEVNDFLDKINEDYSQLLDENSTLKTDLIASNEQLNSYKALQDSLNKSIIIAQQTADHIKKEAEKDRDRIIFDAENKANEIRKTANNDANQIREKAIGQSVELKEKKEAIQEELKKFHNNLINTLTTQLEYANDDNWLNLLQSSLSDKKVISEEPTEDYDDVTQSLLNKNNEVDLNSSESEQTSDSNNSFNFDPNSPIFDNNLTDNGSFNSQVKVPSSNDQENQSPDPQK